MEKIDLEETPLDLASSNFPLSSASSKISFSDKDGPHTSALPSVDTISEKSGSGSNNKKKKNQLVEETNKIDNNNISLSSPKNENPLLDSITKWANIATNYILDDEGEEGKIIDQISDGIGRFWQSTIPNYANIVSSSTTEKVSVSSSNRSEKNDLPPKISKPTKFIKRSDSHSQIPNSRSHPLSNKIYLDPSKYQIESSTFKEYIDTIIKQPNILLNDPSFKMPDLYQKYASVTENPTFDAHDRSALIEKYSKLAIIIDTFVPDCLTVEKFWKRVHFYFWTKINQEWPNFSENESFTEESPNTEFFNAFEIERQRPKADDWLSESLNEPDLDMDTITDMHSHIPLSISVGVDKDHTSVEESTAAVNFENYQSSLMSEMYQMDQDNKKFFPTSPPVLAYVSDSDDTDLDLRSLSVANPNVSRFTSMDSNLTCSPSALPARARQKTD